MSIVRSPTRSGKRLVRPVQATKYSDEPKVLFYWPSREVAESDYLNTASGPQAVRPYFGFWGHGSLTFSRGSTATYRDRGGTLRTAASGSLREHHWDFDENGILRPTTLLEAARTNEFTRSEEVDHGNWTKGNTSITADQATGPDGATSLDELVEDDTGAASNHFVDRDVTGLTADADYALSWFVKAGARDWCALFLLETAAEANRVEAYFDLTNGATGTTRSTGTGSFTRSYVEDWTDVEAGLYRCVVVGSVGNSATAITGRLYLAAGDDGRQYDGDGSSSLYAGYAQVEDDAEFASSYIPTTTGDLAQNSSGKLARYIAGDTDDPFQTADWAGRNATLGVISTGDADDGALAADITNSGEGAAEHTAVASRTKQMVQAEFRSDDSEDGAVGIGAHFQSNNDKTEARYGLSGDNFRLAEWDGGGITNHQQVAKTVDPETYYWASIFVDGTTRCVVYDFADDQELEETASLTEASGTAFFLRRNATGGDRDGFVRNWYQHADRFLEVQGLGAGSGRKVKVLDASDVVLAQATENSGSAFVDLTQVRPDQSVHVIVTDSGDTEIARLTPSDGIWGGSVMTFTSRSADSLYFPFEHDPQEMTVYGKFVEQGTGLIGDGSARLLHIGQTGVGTDPRFFIACGGSGDGYQASHDNGTTVVNASLSGSQPSFGDIVEIRAVLNSDGSVDIGQSINGGTEATASNATTATLQAAWAGERLYLNTDPAGGNAGRNAFINLKVAKGVKSMNEMRQA